MNDEAVCACIFMYSLCEYTFEGKRIAQVNIPRGFYLQLEFDRCNGVLPLPDLDFRLRREWRGRTPAHKSTQHFFQVHISNYFPEI